MTFRAVPGPSPGWIVTTLDSAAMARAFTLATFGAVIVSPAIVRTMGLVAYSTVIAGLCLLGAAILVVRRREIELLRLLPSTVVILAVWLLVTAFWSTDPAGTIVGWIAFAAIAFLAVVIAHVRDSLQTIRALGDVLRAALATSLALEILSGILLNLPIEFLEIQGNIAVGGPVQGLFGTRNMLGFIAVIALITFVVEWRTSSIRRGVAVFSVVLALTLAGFSASPTVLVLALAAAVATAVLYIVRAAAPARRPGLQIAVGTVTVAGLVTAYILRHQIIALLDAGADFRLRGDLWNVLLEFTAQRPVEGFGWFGTWPANEWPFVVINFATDGRHSSALNAYFDVLLQAGWVGLLLFGALCAIAMVRSWLVASTRRSVVYAWTPLILVTLLVDSVFESFTLHGAGLLLLVLCVVRAGLTMSWRSSVVSRVTAD
jgi:exopolysaccharide production protein ExoQ